MIGLLQSEKGRILSVYLTKSNCAIAAGWPVWVESRMQKEVPKSIQPSPLSLSPGASLLKFGFCVMHNSLCLFLKAKKSNVYSVISSRKIIVILCRGTLENSVVQFLSSLLAFPFPVNTVNRQHIIDHVASSSSSFSTSINEVRRGGGELRWIGLELPTLVLVLALSNSIVCNRRLDVCVPKH